MEDKIGEYIKRLAIVEDAMKRGHPQIIDVDLKKHELYCRWKECQKRITDWLIVDTNILCSNVFCSKACYDTWYKDHQKSDTEAYTSTNRSYYEEDLKKDIFPGKLSAKEFWETQMLIL